MTRQQLVGGGTSRTMSAPVNTHRRSISGNIIGQGPPKALPSENSEHNVSQPDPVQPTPAEVVEILPPPGARDRRILVLGETGSGKSTVGNAILGKNLFPVPSSHPISREEDDNLFLKKTRKVDGRRLTVVDTQNLRDCDHGHHTSPARVGMRWLAECSPGPHAFVFVINLYAYHQRLSQDVDRVNWVAQGVIEEGSGTQKTDEETKIRQQETKMGYECDGESGNKDTEKDEVETKQRVKAQSLGEQKEAQTHKKTVGLLSVQQYFGDEALKYTILVFTHGDKLSRRRRKLPQEDQHLKQLIEILRGNKYIISSKSWQKKKQSRKLLNIIDDMLIKNGGRHYNYEIHKALATTGKVENQVRLCKTLQLPFSIPLPPALATIDLSPAGIERFKKMLQRMALGAVTGAIAGGVLGVSLKMATFVLDRLGPSMIGYVSLLVMPLILGGSSGASIGTFSLSSISGGVISGFFLIMTIIGAGMGSIVGAKAAAGVETYKEATKIGAWAVIEKEKAAFLKSLKAVGRRIRGEAEGQGSDLSMESPFPEAGAEENEEPDTEETESKKSTPETKAKDVASEHQKQESDSLRQSPTSETSNQQSDKSKSGHDKTFSKSATEERKDEVKCLQISTKSNIENLAETKLEPHPTKADHDKITNKPRPKSGSVESTNEEISRQTSSEQSLSSQTSSQEPDTTRPDHKTTISPEHKSDGDNHKLQEIDSKISTTNTNSQQALTADTRNNPNDQTTKEHSEDHQYQGIDAQVSFRNTNSVLSHSVKTGKKLRAVTQV